MFHRKIMHRIQSESASQSNQHEPLEIPPVQLVIDFSPRRIIGILIVVMAALILAHAGIQLVDYLISPAFDGWKRLDSLFNLAHEANFPTFYTSFLLLLTAIIVGLTAVAVAQSGTRRYLFHWALLAVVFLGLSIEEQVQIHEFVSENLEAKFDLGGVFTWSWVIPGLILTVVVALVYLRFLLYLPRRYQLLLYIAAALYVGSAIGLEMVSASYSENPNHRFAIEWILVFFEETVELAAVLLFLYAFLNYLDRFIDQVAFNLRPAPSDQPIRQIASALANVSGDDGASQLATPAND